MFFNFPAHLAIAIKSYTHYHFWKSIQSHSPQVWGDFGEWC
jgi:hypothetical protein